MLKMKPIYVYAGMSEHSKKAYVAYERKRRQERMRRTGEMIMRLANVLGEEGKAGYDLVCSMIQREFRFNEAHKFTAILQRRVRLAKDKGLSVTIFKGVSIDASIADEIALVQAYQSKPTGATADTTAFACDDLKPGESKTDAIQYCARLVCDVWNSNEHGGLRRCINYVFQTATKKADIFGACNRARDLVKMWAISLGTIQTVAGEIHSRQGGTKHKKRNGIARPETLREAAKKSRAAEQAETESKGRQRRTAKR